MKVLVSFLVFSVILAACSSSPSEKDIKISIGLTQTAQAPVATPTPENTATPVPLDQIDIEPILFLPGDLPSKFVKGVVSDELPTNIFFNKLAENEEVVIPKSDVLISMVLEDQENKDDWLLPESDLVIWLYSNPDDLAEAYTIISNSPELEDPIIGDEAISPIEIGEKGLFSRRSGFSGAYETVVFTRCNTLVYLGLAIEIGEFDSAQSYAKRLDKRLEPLVCR